MDWRDQFQVDDEKVDGRWLVLAFMIVLLAVAGSYYFYSGGTHVLSDLARERIVAARGGA